MIMKSDSLPLASALPTPPSSPTRFRLAALLLLLPAALWLSVPGDSSFSLVPGCSHARKALERTLVGSKGAASCPAQPDRLNVGEDWQPEEDKEYVQKAVERLQGAVRIRTESFDDMGTPDDDARFDAFADLHKYLEETYPRVYETFEVEKVQKYGLLLTWKGKEAKLKPVVLMAHQDTVPVLPASLNRWTYPPFDATYDKDGWIWGRGVADDKNMLIGILSAFDKLIEDGFEPSRTIILSSGFDEEIGGGRSAAYLAKTLEDRYGQDGVALVLDEGFSGIQQAYGKTFAAFGVAEKGAVSVNLEVLTPGGHSSVPRGKHTGIGIISRLLVALEDHPDTPHLDEGTPLLQYLQCAAQYGDVPRDLKKKIQNPRKWKQLGYELAENDDLARAFLSTTQAEDLIQGGVKINALPEYVKASVNYRIDFLSSVNVTLQHISSVLEPVVRSLNLTFDAYGSASHADNNVVRLSVVGKSEIEPAPITPTEGPAWDLTAGTARHVWPESIAVPTGMQANTDTKHYWNLTKNIYRFVPGSLELIQNFHTVDEKIRWDAHVGGIRFFYKLLQNTEGWDAP
ncbi:hypothetical protein JCM10207_003261 [Rhodosporidiobolus poonsookiae]